MPGPKIGKQASANSGTKITIDASYGALLKKHTIYISLFMSKHAERLEQYIELKIVNWLMVNSILKTKCYKI